MQIPLHPCDLFTFYFRLFIFAAVISGELSAAVRRANRIALHRSTGAPMLGADIEYIAQAIQLQ